MPLVLCLRKCENVIIRHNESGEEIEISLIGVLERRLEARCAFLGNSKTFRVFRKKVEPHVKKRIEGEQPGQA